MNNDFRIRQIVQEELQKNQQRSGFNVQSIPFHTHNGVDSPYIFSPTIIYTGFVPFDGIILNENTSGYVFFPQGWSASYSAGLYTITHNLNTEYYSVTATQDGPDSGGGLSAIVTCLPNSFELRWEDDGAIKYQRDFRFQLVQINNKSRPTPSYIATGASL